MTLQLSVNVMLSRFAKNYLVIQGVKHSEAEVVKGCLLYMLIPDRSLQHRLFLHSTGVHFGLLCTRQLLKAVEYRFIKDKC